MDDEPVDLEQRRDRRRREDRDGFITWAQFRSWRTRATIAFAFLTIVAAGSGYLTYSDSQDRVRQQCLSGGEFRITVAEALDGLRQLAVHGAPPKLVGRFLVQTQPPIDKLLTAAAGRQFRVPAKARPQGGVSASVETKVRLLLDARCSD